MHQTVARHPGFTGGEGKIKVLIGLNGRATTITLLGITDTLLEQCFADRIRGWRLPEAADGKPYTVTFVLAVTVRS